MIALFDLGLALPATAAACAGYRRGAAWARKALFGVLGWFALVGPAVAGMAIAMYVDDDPGASAGQAVAMTVLGLAFTALAAVAYRAAGRGR